MIVHVNSNQVLELLCTPNQTVIRYRSHFTHPTRQILGPAILRTPNQGNMRCGSYSAHRNGLTPDNSPSSWDQNSLWRPRGSQSLLPAPSSGLVRPSRTPASWCRGTGGPSGIFGSPCLPSRSGWKCRWRRAPRPLGRGCWTLLCTSVVPATITWRSHLNLTINTTDDTAVKESGGGEGGKKRRKSGS